jgi:hypothetical protein
MYANALATLVATTTVLFLLKKVIKKAGNEIERHFLPVRVISASCLMPVPPIALRAAQPELT